MAKRLRPYIQQLLHSLRLPSDSVLSVRSRFMSHRRRGQAIVAGRCLLVGDAAGLIDPLSGEGIYSAIKSAQMAASALEKALTEGPEHLQEYQDAVDSHLMPELRISRTLSVVSSLLPRLSFRRFRDDERVWIAFCRLLRGEISYADIARSWKAIRPLLKLAELTG
jgi:flavin-dependent dehydrogenase